MSSLPAYSILPSRASGEHSNGLGINNGPSRKTALHKRWLVRIAVLCTVIFVAVVLFAPRSEAVYDAITAWRECGTPVDTQESAAIQYVPHGLHKDLAAPALQDERYSSEREKAEALSSDGKQPSKIIKLTFQYGKQSIDPTGQKSGMNAVRDQVIQGHIEHARKKGYRQYVQHVGIMHDIRTKHATTLQVLLEELQKPADKRAEWLVMHDADMIVYNYEFPLEIFLPPPDRTDVHLLGTWDGNGFNSGCLFIRVSSLMAQLFGGNIMYDLWPGNRHWEYAEQGMLANMIYDIPAFNQSSVIVPKHWMNAYPPGWEGGFKSGDWILHTVAWSKADLPKYVAEAVLKKVENQVSPDESGIALEVEKFWRENGAKLVTQTSHDNHELL